MSKINLKKDITEINNLSSEELLKKLPGRGRNTTPPVPKSFYEQDWAIFATDPTLQQNIAEYLTRNSLFSECTRIFYKGKPLNVYIIPEESVAAFKKRLADIAPQKNYILHKKKKPKTSQWVLWLGK
ncbi:MAG: hypothetical protein WCO35_00205 [Candidatus Nomurabacteria bacterium]